MSWFKLDDKLRSHPKWLQLDIYARALWVESGLWCAEHNNDGEIPASALGLLGYGALVPQDRLDDACARLVKAKLWRKLPKGAGFVFHDWARYQPLKDQVARREEKRSNHDWLHKTKNGKSVKARVVRRDGKWCRYCGIEVRTDGDRRSPQRRTFDFVDPDVVIDKSPTAGADAIRFAVDSIVISCGYCNAVKNERTPLEAEMPLREAPGTIRPDPPRSIRERIAGDPRSGSDPGAGRDGSGQVGADPVGSGAGTGASGETPPPPTDDHFPGEES